MRVAPWAFAGPAPFRREAVLCFCLNCKTCRQHADQRPAVPRRCVGSYRLRVGSLWGGPRGCEGSNMSSARGLSERAARISSSRRSSSRSRSPARSSAGGSLLDRSRAMSSSRASYRGRSPARPRTPERRSPGRRTPERRSSLSSRAGSMSGRPESPARASLRRAQEMQSRRASSRARAPPCFFCGSTGVSARPPLRAGRL